LCPYEDPIPGFRAGPADHGPLWHTAEHGNRNRYWSRGTIGVAPEQRAAEQHRVTPQTLCKSAEPFFFSVLRDRQRKQKAERARSLCGKIGKVDAKRFARHRLRGISGEKMNSTDDRVGLEHEIAPRWWLDECGVVRQPQRARICRDRLEETRDQSILG